VKEKVVMILARCAQLCTVERNMNAMQIEFTAEMIIKEYWMYSLEDIQLCTERGVTGLYGELYNRLDTSVVFGWLKKYESERMSEIAKRRQKEIETSNIYDVFNNDVMAGALRTVVESLPKATDKPEPKIPELSPFEKMVQDEWDKLKTFSHGLKWYKDEFYDFTDYRKLRYDEELEKTN
jgi:hypothetical protein